MHSSFLFTETSDWESQDDETQWQEYTDRVAEMSKVESDPEVPLGVYLKSGDASLRKFAVALIACFEADNKILVDRILRHHVAPLLKEPNLGNLVRACSYFGFTGELAPEEELIYVQEATWQQLETLVLALTNQDPNCDQVYGLTRELSEGLPHNRTWSWIWDPAGPFGPLQPQQQPEQQPQQQPEQQPQEQPQEQPQPSTSGMPSTKLGYRELVDTIIAHAVANVVVGGADERKLIVQHRPASELEYASVSDPDYGYDDPRAETLSTLLKEPETIHNLIQGIAQQVGKDKKEVKAFLQEHVGSQLSNGSLCQLSDLMCPFGYDYVVPPKHRSVPVMGEVEKTSAAARSRMLNDLAGRLSKGETNRLAVFPLDPEEAEGACKERRDVPGYGQSPIHTTPLAKLISDKEEGERIKKELRQALAPELVRQIFYTSLFEILREKTLKAFCKVLRAWDLSVPAVATRHEEIMLDSLRDFDEVNKVINNACTFIAADNFNALPAEERKHHPARAKNQRAKVDTYVMNEAKVDVWDASTQGFSRDQIPGLLKAHNLQPAAVSKSCIIGALGGNHKPTVNVALSDHSVTDSS